MIIAAVGRSESQALLIMKAWFHGRYSVEIRELRKPSSHKEE
jgi:hypothetical protein